jgi:hypothetical protein
VTATPLPYPTTGLLWKLQLVAKKQLRVGGEGRNRAPLVADDKVIMPYFMGDSSRLCQYWNIRFPLGLLAILLAIYVSGSSGQHVGGKIGAILGARVTDGETASRARKCIKESAKAKTVTVAKWEKWRRWRGFRSRS